MLSKISAWFIRIAEPLLPPRRLIIVHGDSLPSRMPLRSLVLARDGDEDWCIGFRCPCGCSRTIELLVIDEAKPRWTYALSASGAPSLHPSVWLNNGCKSHFWLRHGRIHWVR